MGNQITVNIKSMKMIAAEALKMSANPLAGVVQHQYQSVWAGCDSRGIKFVRIAKRRKHSEHAQTTARNVTLE